MRILFICKHNRFRSKVAEAFAKKLDKKNKYFSAGIEMDKKRPWPSRVANVITKSRGYMLKGKPKKVTRKMMDESEIIVIAANNVSKSRFKGFKGRIIVWKIPDAHSADVAKVERIMTQIEKRVKKLVIGLK